MKTRLIIVGGFLGAGKTTLLWESARLLTHNGNRVGLITNDQATELVDTAFLEYENNFVEEISGSCFCCNFNGFSDAVTRLAQKDKCSLILAEPVGSCTDLSATILQPLKDLFDDELSVSPLSVLVDPERLEDLMDGGTAGLHESAAYIVKKQLEEADCILITKSDLMEDIKVRELSRRAELEWPHAKIFCISSKSGVGLEAWLEEVLNRSDGGTHLTEVDYNIYAEGEAILGWYNASFELKGRLMDGNYFIRHLMKSLSERFARDNIAIGHLKALISNTESFLVANLTGIGKTVTTRGSMENCDAMKLTINARVQISPEDLDDAITSALMQVCGDQISCITIAAKSLSPGRPNPTYRYGKVI